MQDVYVSENYDGVATSLESEVTTLVITALDYFARIRQRQVFACVGPRQWAEEEEQRYASWWESRQKLEAAVEQISQQTSKMCLLGEGLKTARG